jgi:Rrf2 family cysteine metabolism transcriptional repressor
LLSKTTDTAIMALLYLVLREEDGPVSPRIVASRIGVSATYLAKVFNNLRRAGILRSHRGARGGVTLQRNPSQITLLDIYRACQKVELEEEPAPPPLLSEHCNFHQAMTAFGQSMTGTLSQWTLRDLAADPCPAGSPADHLRCRVSDVCPKRRFRNESGGTEP